MPASPAAGLTLPQAVLLLQPVLRCWTGRCRTCSQSVDLDQLTPQVFLIGMEEMIFPHARSIEENDVEEERRLAYVGMTRAMERLVLIHSTARTLFGRREYNLPSRFLDELPSEVARERLRPTSWSGYAASPRQLPGREPRSQAATPSLSTGDSVRHGSLGEGVVTKIEPGGVVTVRFASDGSERRLMIDYAPLERL